MPATAESRITMAGTILEFNGGPYSWLGRSRKQSSANGKWNCAAHSVNIFQVAKLLAMRVIMNRNLGSFRKRESRCFEHRRG